MQSRHIKHALPSRGEPFLAGVAHAANISVSTIISTMHKPSVITYLYTVHLMHVQVRAQGSMICRRLCPIYQTMIRAEAAAKAGPKHLSPYSGALPLAPRPVCPRHPLSQLLLPRAPGLQAKAPDLFSCALYLTAIAPGLLQSRAQGLPG